MSWPDLQEQSLILSDKHARLAAMYRRRVARHLCQDMQHYHELCPNPRISAKVRSCQPKFAREVCWQPSTTGLRPYAGSCTRLLERLSVSQPKPRWLRPRFCTAVFSHAVPRQQSCGAQVGTMAMGKSSVTQLTTLRRCPYQELLQSSRGLRHASDPLARVRLPKNIVALFFLLAYGRGPVGYLSTEGLCTLFLILDPFSPTPVMRDNQFGPCIGDYLHLSMCKVRDAVTRLAAKNRKFDGALNGRSCLHEREVLMSARC
jgi:hypothetical protein